MRKTTFRLLSVLLAMLMLVSFVACSGGDTPTPTPTPDPPVEYTTKYYMPNGWATKVETPMWGDPDPGTVKVPDAILQGDMEHEVTNVTPELKAALAEALATPDYFKDVKNVIIIIGDGMGITHVRASEQWSGELIMTQLPNIGASTTLTREGIYTDSGAGGNAISTGYKTTRLFLNMDAEGNNLMNVSELGRSQGKLVGVVTNAELADATPADFTVHNKNRSQGWTKIEQQQIVFGADLFMGNGGGEYTSYFGPSNDLYPFVEANNMKKYTSASTIVNGFNDANKMWALFSGTANKFARFDTKSANYPNLQQMTAYALSWLDAHDTDDQGFVVMIENTYPDHFGHGNIPNDGSANTYGIVKEVQSTDEAVAIALKYVLEHPDTALIVTADHETGNTQLRPGWEEDFSQVRAASGDHSTQPVPVFAIGKGTEALNTLQEGQKWYEAATYVNATIGQVIGDLLGVEDFGGDVNTDTYGKTSAEFEITLTESTNKLTYTLDFEGVPIRSGNLVQFKIKPQSKNDKIQLVLIDKNGKEIDLLKETAFSDSTATAITPAYKQAFVEKSGLAEGWYQISLSANAGCKIMKVVLTPASGSYASGSTIGMDDLTVQYASTIGELLFKSDQASAAGDPLIVLK
jgi:alkaline phosphatase